MYALHDLDMNMYNLLTDVCFADQSAPAYLGIIINCQSFPTITIYIVNFRIILLLGVLMNIRKLTTTFNKMTDFTLHSNLVEVGYHNSDQKLKYIVLLSLIIT